MLNEHPGSINTRRGSAGGEMKIFFILVAVALKLFFFWMVLSIVSSGVKATSNNCGNVYGIDSVVMSNLFCPIKSRGVEGKQEK